MAVGTRASADRLHRWSGAAGGGEWPVTLGFTLVYLVAAFAGRATIVDDASMSLLWPGAGVALLWYLARSGDRVPWRDVALLGVSSWGVAAATGSHGIDSVFLGPAPVVQVLIAHWVLRRRAPRLLAERGRLALRHVDDLWGLTLAAFAGSLGAAVVASAVVPIAGDAGTLAQLLPRLIRNTGSIVLIVPVGLALAEWWTRRLAHATSSTGRRPWRGAEVAEHVAALGLLPVTYALWFWAFDEVPLAFPLILLTVWAGARLRTWFVVLHDTVTGGVAVALTLAGVGPFSVMGDLPAEVVVAQLYVTVVCLIGLSLALSRAERLALLGDVATARDEARAQASLLSTVVDTMSDGISVITSDGRVILHNPRANEFLGRSPEDPRARVGALQRMDGRTLDEDDLPYRRALAGHTVHGLRLRARDPEDPRGRVLSFTSHRLPADDSVVTLMHDVTAEYRELERAAQVQASLLPAGIPDVPGYELAARFVPAGMVGGDFYDWDLDGDVLTLTVADVMGKGPGAAILAAASRAGLRANVSTPDVAAIVEAGEELLEGDLTRAGAFVTLALARIDLASGDAARVDAGHGLMFVMHDGALRRLEAGGPPLGVLPGGPRRAETFRLDPGDLLVAFSDGVLDAMGGSLSDLTSLETALKGACTAQDAVDAVVALTAEAEVTDDLTVVALRRGDAA